VTQEIHEEILEIMWLLEEQGQLSRPRLEQSLPDECTGGRLDELLREGLIRMQGDEIGLTPEGNGRARAIVRSHRLAERLLKDVLNMEDARFEEEACGFEHNLTPGIVDSICTLLGHPHQCPHGHPIPEGPCCRETRAMLGSVVANLPALRVGEKGTVAYLNTSKFDRIKKLYAFGIVPGVPVELIQRSPAFVLRVEESQIALEQAVAEDIFIRRQSD